MVQIKYQLLLCHMLRCCGYKFCERNLHVYFHRYEIYIFPIAKVCNIDCDCDCHRLPKMAKWLTVDGPVDEIG